MIQLDVLSGNSAGVRKAFKTFPVSIGRSSESALCLSDPGMFDLHCQIDATPEGFVLIPAADAVTTLNGVPGERTTLRNGDVIGAGLAKIQFGLGTLEQRGLRARELLAWFLVAAIAGIQIYLFARLLEMAR